MESIKELKQHDKLVVKHKGKRYTIDLAKELAINENIINSQLKESPSSYSFLSSLKNSYIKERDKLERAKDIAYSEAYVFYKNSKVSGMTNELANHKANTAQKYTSLYEKWINASKKANDLISICKAYESREKLLQTLSANIRKEQ